ncbi:hypothetical protein BGW36DRAFT_365423 [Talaromyces proteolyticus]|uniref:Serine-rich protein n=1 Tax=Talaromyces proteolyticus TaxID=1131652 RepID=A0AAD4PUQ6_9EURO|nr:uncharacterized protein BGW36DRAFT_365423 [Talaromyces proteolyticus]KAH8689657.1 hypothetical protein BGW36DRAFT_365423 [Talaromyces proteolyticus]
MSPRSSTTASPRRRALHERTSSHTNEVSPIRSVKETEDIDFYSATPYPTKPTQVLLPRPGIGQSYGIHGAYGVSDVSLASAETDLTATGPADENKDFDTSVNNPYEFSSSVDLGHSSQVWDHDPQSSQSSFPTPLLPSDDSNDSDYEATYDNKATSNFQHQDSSPQLEQPHYERELHVTDSGEEEEPEDDDDVITLPPPPRATVKAIPPGYSSPRTEPLGDQAASDNYVTYDHTSSPNVVPIGAPSSPNFVSLQSSSPNLIAYGSSSPQIIANDRSDSDSSSNSMGTVIRTYNGSTGWPGPSFEGSSSQPASFTSSPPVQLLREYQSASSLALSAGETQLSRSRTISTGSGPSEGDSHSLPDSISAIQYPRIRAPSSSGSFADVSEIRRPTRTVSERSTGRWNPTLSTVPSRVSEDQGKTVTLSNMIGGTASDVKQGLGLMPTRSKSKSTIWPIDQNDEHLDRVSNLPRSTLRHIPSSLFSSTESRPGSSSSNNMIMNVLPNWVRLYYRGNNGQLAQHPTLSILESSRPSTAASRPASPIRYVSRAPAYLARPRTRPREEKAHPTRLLSDHPADPRSHWKQGQREEHDIAVPQPVAKAWSPHLHPDKGQTSPRHTWTAPSLDSRDEPAFGRRNVQIYSFCLGFVFPLAWVIAAFLPLPQPLGDEEDMVAGSGAKYRIQQHEKKRIQSARWWRNVNRVMIPVGTAIIAIIVTLAVVGTTVGFS